MIKTLSYLTYDGNIKPGPFRLTDIQFSRRTKHITPYNKHNVLLQYRQNKRYNEYNLCGHARHVIIFRFVTETDYLSLTVTAADFMSHDVTRCDFCVAIETRIYVPLYSFRSILKFSASLSLQNHSVGQLQV